MPLKSKVAYEAFKCRQTFVAPIESNVQNWFPRHMYASLKHMQAKIRLIDCVIEVHDARIPFTGRNPTFKRTLYGGTKPHVLVLNKMDLINRRHYEPVEQALYKSDDSLKRIIWADCKSRTPEALHQLMEAVDQQIIGLPRYNREYTNEYNLLVIGIPNVGKSSLINAMRSQFARIKNDATAVGACPGVTKSVMNKIAVHENPKIYVLDTPGILPPNVIDIESGMKLALCETVLQHYVGEEYVADYLLYLMNKTKNYKYVTKFCLEQPTNDCFAFLFHIALTNKFMRQMKQGTGVMELKPDLKMASKKFLTAFRKGEFGDQFADIDKLNELSKR